MLVQNSYNLLTIFLAADGGWPPAANFTLVEQRLANQLRQVKWLASSRHKSPTRDIFEQITVFNNAVIIKYENTKILKEHLFISPESGLRSISNRNE